MSHLSAERWACALILALVYGMPVLASGLGVGLLLNGEVVRGAVSVAIPPVFGAWYLWDSRHSWERPSELLWPMTKAWLCGLPVGLVAWGLARLARTLWA
ncbi:hypothetical protein [Pelomonas sp. SE-A7]|uniref:hypothetical protein n=1 Tax=Pelomonas sp. SE-A7 TaxID=3054953 RepID=UPI00259CCF03|nr:hypothetical protein [Pelomonas sp. SE-A7]MDM4768262.1 hypothetical protein [Pelomonas sp. SE-A7]